jgi:hypothetical protein
MDIEERELQYSPEAPLCAWRLFRVRPSHSGFVLSSPMYHNPDPPPWPNVRSVASCYEGHPAPAPGCRCGIYAAIPGTLDSLPGYLLDTAHDGDPWAYAEVSCSGRVFVDMRGVRAERAEILGIALPTSCWTDEASLDTARRRLGERYALPIDGVAGVPEWVSSNLRDQGPPADASNLALDLQRLYLRI